MRFYVISDNIDTLMGMRLAGIEGIVVHEKEEVLPSLADAMKQSDIGIILMTTKLIQLCPKLISHYKMTYSKPLIVEIPDRHGSSQIGAVIDKYVSEAIGIKL